MQITCHGISFKRNGRTKLESICNIVLQYLVTDCFPGKYIQDHRQVNKARQDMDLRDIGFPGWFRDPACRLGIAFPGVKLA
jgi:hypothetical protein